ncbi:MAG: hypothetical protein Q4P18_05945 [Methanobrevibacter sp.]|uniref:hypothetical protein n=1 Tax=Methanobrevibacter sp. TaxID=66852 RepID=UPI0026DEE249|nr:hypothetical protein [Methanobrevibacter sp.]MDO5849055.1 hypothetical protein [Methanobrevibacter sp.]
MPFPGQMPFDLRSLFIKVSFLIGALIIIYAVLWILAVLKIIPAIIYALFPQVVLLCIGIFIIYVAYTKKKEYY